ncbi:hypothetical protein BCR36DRAFT_580577 [Piromyces finnis]|uniref:Mid2 domain-containing protein n=1 Tax=Piromyces finnis TaxID=1754191 RepID=A0A1Y1VJC9_9FUNG|nr:hypothetical protein BCR36DRAFT_580577 [Piromyces finnis]|eukprot:ORX57162.1 hypothetical protein BCR36DRAFT_580577 [Piromyces finnis]
MKFTRILTIAASFALAYAQVYDGGIVSDLESNQIPDSTDIAPQNTYDNLNAGGEISDDYGDNAGIDALDAYGESSDVESNPVSPPISTPDSSVPEETTPQSAAAPGTTLEPVQQNESSAPMFTGASGEAAAVAQQEAQSSPIAALDDTSKTDTTIDPAKIASGLVGAAALSSAGIFFMVKRAKRRGLESVRSQISMA